VTPSRWDRYLAGDHAALTADEVTGLKLFTDLGCMTGHTRRVRRRLDVQKVGVAKPWPNHARAVCPSSRWRPGRDGTLLRALQKALQREHARVERLEGYLGQVLPTY
jgi:hypothetical protein